MLMSPLERRIIDISYKKKLSHIGSCLTAVALIDEIFAKKEYDEPFILSNGHAGLALYAVLEKYKYGNAEELFDQHGVHPNTDVVHRIWCSTGSLGHGIGIAVGMAFANKNRNVYALISDGECAEGSVWESLRLSAELGLRNLHVTINANGYGANGVVDSDWLQDRLRDFFPCDFRMTNMTKWPPFLQGLQAHYHVLTKEEHETLTESDEKLPVSRKV
jgi:transketolase